MFLRHKACIRADESASALPLVSAADADGLGGNSVFTAVSRITSTNRKYPNRTCRLLHKLKICLIFIPASEDDQKGYLLTVGNMLKSIKLA